ncbi:hydroxyisourate hydrolase [Acidiphilium sp. AL]|uniref:5-hydroxyisourate hydrolase n=1 Tax=Acidiphilium iwatense TaxID=768198 RepID=A0ABS9DXW8_9PROT|nr:MULTISPECIES: hydroxyisourate hydrolase [Acidiphilium]MCF3947588.1 hydroxyisourate hydrolase [Acidiphilium iwatense]MCU4160754.1 hydroxyisourate hydrolase [Acidiphilium sp. AL]
MTRLTTHILDTANGRPASGVRIRLYAQAQPGKLLAEAVTDANGRAACTPQDAAGLPSGVYDLVFSIGPYFAAQSREPAPQTFLDDIVLRFGMNAEEPHYHIPLLVSPWSYTTYRGS